MSNTIEQRERNVSQRKLPIVQSASFDTLIEAIKAKSEKAQCTLMYRLVEEVDGEVLAALHKYTESEIKRRARAIPQES